MLTDWRPPKPGKQLRPDEPKGSSMFTHADIERFYRRFDRRGPDECWPWNYVKGHAGHGRMWAGGRNTLASHIALHLDGRPRAGGLAALHSCDNPECVNPRHLRWGTQLENIADRVSRGRNRSPTGEDSGRSKLSYEQVLMIISDNRSSRFIANDYGISRSMVCRIKSGKAWRHVDSQETGKADLSRMQRQSEKQKGSMPFREARRSRLDVDVPSLRVGRSA